MSLHSIGFNEEISKIIPKLSSNVHLISSSADCYRFPVYFQMNKGVVLEDSIIMPDEEPIHIANLKRGLISQIQFPYMSDIATTEEVLHRANMPM